MKNAEIYFEKARKLPLAISYDEIKSLVHIKGITQPPVKKMWWNLNNLIIMTTALIISTATVMFFSTEVDKEENISLVDSQEANSIVIQENSSITPKIEFEEVIQEKEPNSVNIQDSVLIEDTFDSILETTIKETKQIFEEVNNDILQPNNIFETINEQEVLFANDSTENFESIEDFEPVANQSSILEINNNQKTITKEISSDGVLWFKLANNDGDIKIENWDQAKVSLVATVTMKSKDEEDIQKGLEDFQLDFLQKGEKLLVKHNWDDYESCKCWPSNRKNRVKTEKGEKIKINELQIDYALKLPKNINLDLKNNYGDIVIGDLEGDLLVSLFQGDLHAGNIEGKLKLNGRYGKSNISDFTKGEVSLFQAEAKLGKSDEVKLNARYSKVQLGGTNKLSLSSFQSDIDSEGNIKEVEGSLRYGKLNLEKASQIVTLNMFKGNLNADNIDHLDLDISYSKIDAQNIKSCHLENAFQTNIKINEVDEFSGKARYTPIEIKSLNNKLVLNTFQANVKIQQIRPTLKDFNLISRYTNIKLKFDSKSSMQVEAKTAYTNVSIPPGFMNINSESKSGNYRHDFKGSYGLTNSNKVSKVYIDSFQGSLLFDFLDEKVSKHEGSKEMYQFAADTSYIESHNADKILVDNDADTTH